MIIRACLCNYVFRHDWCTGRLLTTASNHSAPGSLRFVLLLGGQVTLATTYNTKPWSSHQKSYWRQSSQPSITMPTTRWKGWIDWWNSKAKEMVLEDLIEGIVPLTDEECMAEEAWEVWYKNMAEFVRENVLFEQFKDRFKDHHKQISSKKIKSHKEMQAFLHHRSLHPEKTHNEKGEPLYDVHPAKPLLQDDVQMKKHKAMTPTDLQASRTEYGAFSLKVFRQHIYQEVHRQKFVFYLNIKRAEKLRKLARTTCCCCFSCCCSQW